MDPAQLTGRLRRLKDELARASEERPVPAGRIDRLMTEIADAEQAIAARMNSPASAPRSSATPRLARTAAVALNRMTPFGRRDAEPAAE